MIVLLILLLTLDFQRFELPDEAMATSFVVLPLENESRTDCAVNPQNGVFNSSPLLIDRSKPPEFATENTVTWALPTSNNEVGGNNHPAMVVVSLGGNFQPTIDVPANDTQPPTPVSVTPEPSTIMILGITAAVLSFFMFGRRRRRRS